MQAIKQRKPKTPHN